MKMSFSLLVFILQNNLNKHFLLGSFSTVKSTKPSYNSHLFVESSFQKHITIVFDNILYFEEQLRYLLSKLTKSLDLLHKFQTFLYYQEVFKIKKEFSTVVEKIFIKLFYLTNIFKTCFKA